eukprot:2351876-Rhodomonas_salina.1
MGFQENNCVWHFTFAVAAYGNTGSAKNFPRRKNDTNSYPGTRNPGRNSNGPGMSSSSTSSSMHKDVLFRVSAPRRAGAQIFCFEMIPFFSIFFQVFRPTSKTDPKRKSGSSCKLQ